VTVTVTVTHVDLCAVTLAAHHSPQRYILVFPMPTRFRNRVLAVFLQRHTGPIIEYFE